MDFGSGTGRISIPFLQLGFDIHAVYISESSLNVLKLFYHQHKTKSWGKLSTSTTIPKNMLFDGVVGSDILHHVNISKELSQLHKILYPNGLIVFSEPNAWHLPWYAYIFLVKLPWRIEKGIIHCNFPNLIKVLKQVGFSSISIEGHGLLPLPNSIHNLLPKKIAYFDVITLGSLFLFKFFALRLIIKAKK